MVVINPNLLPKTALVSSLKLAAPADRTGSGVNVIDHYPMAILSLGHFPLPRFPEPEPRSRRTVADEQSMPPQGLPDGPAGSDSGPLARRRPARKAVTTPPAGNTTGTVNPAVPVASRRVVPASRLGRLWSPQRLSRLGSDCQSPDRQDAKCDLTANRVNPAWRQAAGTTPAAKK